MYRDHENGSIGGGSSSGNHHPNHHSHFLNNHHIPHNNSSHHVSSHHHHLQNNSKAFVSSGASNGAGPLPVLPGHKSHPRLIEPSLSRWTANPVSLPPRISPSSAIAASTSSPFSSSTASSTGGILGPSRIPSQVPTVPQRNSNGLGDNWVDLEELYRWLQELEDTKIEEISDEDHSFGKRFYTKRNKVTNPAQLAIKYCKLSNSSASTRL